VRDNPLGELDEVIVDRAVGHPRTELADEPPISSSDGQLERPWGDFDLKLTPAQDDHIRAPCMRNRHAAKFLRVARDPMPPVTKWSQDVTSFFTNLALCRVILIA
jgi:hypothetical protein